MKWKMLAWIVGLALVHLGRDVSILAMRGDRLDYYSGPILWSAAGYLPSLIFLVAKSNLPMIFGCSVISAYEFVRVTQIGLGKSVMGWNWIIEPFLIAGLFFAFATVGLVVSWWVRWTTGSD